MQIRHHVLAATALAMVSGGITWAVNGDAFPWAAVAAGIAFLAWWVGLMVLVVIWEFDAD